MIGNTHIDAIWLWNKAEGMQEVKASFASALERMKEFSDFKFTQSSIAYLEWIKENCPKQFEEIQKRVEEGRWEIVGGMWVEPDCNLPSGESLIRQFLYGKEFVEKNFGKEVITAYNVDSFGHGINLPAICNGCGIKYYLMSRPDKNHVKVPPVFIWKAKNGDSVVAERTGGEYMAWTRPALERNLSESLEALEEYGYDRMAVFYGVGNHGGGPTIENIRTIYEMREENTNIDLDFSTITEFFEQVETEKIPECCQEMGRIFSGCYSSDKKIKELNRKGEWMLQKAEIIGCMAQNMGVPQYRYPKEEMERAWKGILFNQFHDVLAGTSIETARNEACQAFEGAIAEGRQMVNYGIQAIANQIDTQGEGFPLILFNPASTVYQGVFEANIYVPRARKKNLRLKNFKGEEIEYCETTYKNYSPESRKGILFEADVPAYGYSIYRVIYEGPEVEEKGQRVCAEEDILDNGIVKILFHPETGCPASVIKDGKELLEQFCAVNVYYDDRGAWGEDIYEEKKLGTFAVKKSEVIESNAMRGILRYLLVYQNSEMMIDYILEKNSDKLKTSIRLRNAEKHSQISLDIPVSANEVHVVNETAFFAEEKVDCCDINSEHYQHRFADITDKSGKGIAVLNDGIYAFRQVNHIYKLILLRNTIFARGGKGPVEEILAGCFTNQGMYDYEMEWIFHEKELKKRRLFEEADRMHLGIEYLSDSNHIGKVYKRRSSFVQFKTENIHISTIKCSHDGNGKVVIRLFETEGTNGYGEIQYLGRDVRVELSPYEIKTLYLEERGIKECSMLEK